MKAEKGLMKMAMMNTDQRYEYIALNGIHLASSQDGDLIRSLFACEDFFVEFRIQVFDPKTIVMFIFIDPVFLDIYLQEIDISSLFF